MLSLILHMILLITAISAAPSALRHEIRNAHDDGFSLQVHRQQLSRMKSPRRVMDEVRAKYGKHTPVQQKAYVNASAGTVIASPARYDQEYLAPVYIGGQLLQLDLDTGSSDTWVFSTQLPPSEQGTHNLYDPSKSSTAKLLNGSTWSVSYGDGSQAGGRVYKDCVWVGGTRVEQQGIEVANSVSPSFVSDSNDGLVGLGFDSINNANPTQKTFVQNAYAQGLPLPLFTADLYPGAPGSYDFGFINKSKYSDDLAYIPINNSRGFWQVTATGWSFGYPNETPTQSARSFHAPTVVDTGTSIIFWNLNVVRGYWETVTGSDWSDFDGGYIFPCSADLPDFTVKIGNFSATVPGHLLNYSPASTDATMCYGGLQNEEMLEFNILGDVFLKTLFVVFDQNEANPQVGFAPKAKH